MKLHLVHGEDGPIIWAHKSQRATVGRTVSVMGVIPFLFLLMFPYATFFYLSVINLALDIYRTKKRVLRWADVFRRFRFFINGGYWYVQSKQRVRHGKWAWDDLKGRRY
ncbi:hypothetical protein [Marinobacter gelidimuriae]|jgi:hypothetical protein|uniref:hypothetical protein n=1 Tax=Marinobacter gelidimuriae TaxID=2739064 RepID=UPI00037C6295|nr:hypothetical protein [Marinobacter gelidimuriae]